MASSSNKFDLLSTSTDGDSPFGKAKSSPKVPLQPAVKTAKKNANKKKQPAQVPVEEAKPTKTVNQQEVKLRSQKTPPPATSSNPTQKSPKEPTKPASPKKRQQQPEPPKRSENTAVDSAVSVEPKSADSRCTLRLSASQVQSVFVYAVSACYFFAFASFYYQIRGLYGDNGVLPLRHYAASLAASKAPEPILWQFANFYGLTLTTTLEVVTLFGTVLSFSQLVSGSFRKPIIYLSQFVLYLTILQVGQTFLHFQWDALLLEVGALTVLASWRGKTAPDARLLYWPVRLLLFKLMFSSGVVKLTSGCPLWWSLGALDVHFESQCIPTAFAWYAHHLPTNWLHLATALTYVIEIVLPFLFLVPLRSAQLLSFYTQVPFQLAIILTGNYNFFNLLTIALCIPLLETPPAKPKDTECSGCVFARILKGLFIGSLAWLIIAYFQVNLKEVTDLRSFFTVGPSSQINFTAGQYNSFLGLAILVGIWQAAISLSWTGLRAFFVALGGPSEGFLARTCKVIGTLIAFLLCVACWVLVIVPLARLDPTPVSMRRIPAPIKGWYQAANDFSLASDYGLFRRMTGKDGRPELVIEGTNDPNNETWMPYEFKYKPGNVKNRPSFNIPHQPRLDWQMWFAALATYQENPWLLNLCYRILTSQRDVLHLLDFKQLPFPINSPPKYLRVSRYTYKFAEPGSTDWWKLASNRHAYIPVVNKDTLAAALKLEEIKVPAWIEKLPAIEASRWPFLTLALDALYECIVIGNRALAPHVLMWIAFVVCCLLQRCGRCSEEQESPARETPTSFSSQVAS